MVSSDPSSAKLLARRLLANFRAFHKRASLFNERSFTNTAKPSSLTPILEELNDNFKYLKNSKLLSNSFFYVHLKGMTYEEYILHTASEAEENIQKFFVEAGQLAESYDNALSELSALKKIEINISKIKEELSNIPIHTEVPPPTLSNLLFEFYISSFAARRSLGHSSKRTMAMSTILNISDNIDSASGIKLTHLCKKAQKAMGDIIKNLEPKGIIHEEQVIQIGDAMKRLKKLQSKFETAAELPPTSPERTL